MIEQKDVSIPLLSDKVSSESTKEEPKGTLLQKETTDVPL